MSGRDATGLSRSAFLILLALLTFSCTEIPDQPSLTIWRFLTRLLFASRTTARIVAVPFTGTLST